MFKSTTGAKAEDKRARLKGVRVLIADSDVRTAELVRRVLYSFGFRHIFIADNGVDALYMVRAKKADLIITESRMERRDGVALVKLIRGIRDDPHLRRDVPIIMLTADAELPDVRAARDAGITEFLVKPFTAKTLSNRIIQVIDHPRIFVESANFVGPCRRRKRPAAEGDERRRSPEVKEADNVLFAGVPGITQIETLAEANIYAPNYAIRAQLGTESMEDILNPSIIAGAQDSLMEAESEYVSWARDDIAKLEIAYKELVERPGDPMAHHLIVTSAYSIKAQAGIFGYGLGSDIGKQLLEYLQQNPVMDANRLLVVRKHIDTINVVFTQKIKDSGQLIARELMKGLHDLIHKIG